MVDDYRGVSGLKRVPYGHFHIDKMFAENGQVKVLLTYVGPDEASSVMSEWEVERLRAIFGFAKPEDPIPPSDPIGREALAYLTECALWRLGLSTVKPRSFLDPEPPNRVP